MIDTLPTGGVRLNDQQDIPREAMLGLRPDLVLSTWGGGFSEKYGFATREELKAVGANSYVPKRFCDEAGADAGKQTIEDSYALLRDLGRIFGVDDKAEQLVAASRKAIDDVSAKVAGRPASKVMVLMAGRSNGGDLDLSTTAANGIWNDVLAKAGGSNAFAGASRTLFVNPSAEQVAATPVDALVIVAYRNPDAAGDAARLFARFPQWPAARANRFVVLSDSVYLGPSNALAVQRIATVLHPGSA